MSTIFNAGRTGTFNTSGTFVPAMSSAGAVYIAGNLPITIGLRTTIPTQLSPSVTIKGVFLNIAKVKPDATSTFAISFEAGDITTTYNYYTSSLYQGKTTCLQHTTPQYWQGFDFNRLDLTGFSTVTVILSSSSPGDIILVGDKKGEINRYFISDTLADYYSAFHSVTSPNDFFIGDYAESIEFGNAANSTSSTYIVCDYTTPIVRNITINNNATFELSSTNLVVTGTEFLMTPGSTLFASNSSIIDLNATSMIGMDGSVISATGIQKIPYTFLTNTILSGDNICNTIDNIESWRPNDSILFAHNTSINSSEIATLSSIITNFSFDINNFVTKEHYSITDPAQDIFKTGFFGSPVCNLTRDTIIRGPRARSIVYSEGSGILHLTDITLSGLGVPVVANKSGAINIYNDNTFITGCNIIDNAAGIYVNSQSATNFNINNNNIYNSTSYGIVIALKSPIVYLTKSNINKNVVISSKAGIVSNFYTNIYINSNILVGNTNEGLLLNQNNDYNNILGNCTILSVDNNTLFSNGGNGVTIGTSAGYLTNTTSQNNRGTGIACTSTDFNTTIGVLSASTAFNNIDGLALYSGHYAGNSISAANIISVNNGRYGVSLNGIFGSTSNAALTGNNSYGLYVNNCNSNILNINNYTVNSNQKSVLYSYPNLGGWNFYPTYLSNSIITNNRDNTCINLSNTKCEKFVVDNTKFDSLSCNITLLPASNSLIEGSYLFNGCTFSSIPLDDVRHKYQTNILSETGFSSMFENNNLIHSKTIAAGEVKSDVTVYKDVLSPISEKLTPNSTDILLKSSKKTIFLDNYDSSIPPNSEPEYLYASVWVKKSDNWGNNSNPRLVIAANPTLNIVSDLIITEHANNTTEWVQLSTIVPCASAISTRAPVEMYIDCSGESGGSIYVDQWGYTIARNI